MKRFNILGSATARSVLTASAALLTALSAAPGQADDTEIFVGRAEQANATRPNIMFILDTSGSMSANVVTNTPWDSSQEWEGDCDADTIYWRSGTGAPPACNTTRFFPAEDFMCSTGANAVRTAGFYTDQFAMNRVKNDGTGQFRWRGLRAGANEGFVECTRDFGVHGGGDPDDVFPRNNSENNPWSDQENRPAWNAYTVYTGNYINWYYNARRVSQTRLQIMQQVLDNLLDSLEGVNTGLMRFSINGVETEGGGMVLQEMAPVEDARAGMRAQIASWDADGWTPLSESLYEAAQYYRGSNVYYGNASRGSVNGTIQPLPSIPESRDASATGSYRSPLEESCQKSFVVMLTDGLPTRDTGADTLITQLPDYGNTVGAGCDWEGITDGRCLDDLAEYMFEADLQPNVPGQQGVTTYTIGFDVSHPVLIEAAQRGGGEFFFANDTTTLATALSSIVTEILDDTVTFTAPAVSVNAFNRTQNLNDVYITTFQASDTAQWPGNLKKYRIKGGELTGQDGNTVVDPNTGFFKDNAFSYWSASADGAVVTQGGAASKLPDPATRRIFTDLNGGTLTAVGNAFTTTNPAVTRAALNIDSRPELSREDVINFGRGVDVLDQNGNGTTADARLRLGDPLHAKPAILIYGGTPANPDLGDAVVYFSDNEGFLHAVDPDTGAAYWSYLPSETMGNLASYMVNEETGNKIYGLDGNIRAVRQDKNDNGIIEPAAGDRVVLYFGMRRGGETLYAVDVTRKDSPRLMWKADSATLPGVGQTWSTPVPAKVNIGGTLRSVLIVGGGYDTRQDVTLYSRDTVGRAIYMLDADTGALLWRAGGTGSGADLVNANLDNSIPGDIRVLDMSGDGLADRMYAADTGGQVWRFDINNGGSGASLVSGDVFASLGAADMATPTTAESRRFYYAPDVALIQKTESNPSYINIAIGSGLRASPNNVFIRDRFYALRDYDVFNQLTAGDYSAKPTVVEGDLVDVTGDLTPNIPAGSAGWFMELRNPIWRGEKVLAEARQFQNQILFTTFTPGGGASNTCAPSAGQNRLYVVSAVDGSPTVNLDQSADPDVLTLSDRFQDLEQGGISPEVVFIFPSPDDPDNCEGEECAPPPVCLVGLESCQAEFNNAPVRTFWTQEGAE